jgi:hypothetical protein
VRLRALALSRAVSAVDVVFSAARTASQVEPRAALRGPAVGSAEVPAVLSRAAGPARESGSGAGPEQQVSDQEPEQPAVLPVGSAPADNRTPATPAAPPEAEVRDASFADMAWLGLPEGAGTASGQVAAEPAGVLDSAGAAVGLAAMCVWGARPTEQDEKRRRLAA